MERDPLAWLSAAAADREAAGLTRRLVARQADDDLLDLASNDYLGLARHPDVVKGAVAATETWGAGSTGSRLVTGHTELHAELEDALATFAGAEAALVFSSGYTANLGVIEALAGPGTLVVSESANHASIIDACRLSRARLTVAPHADLDAVERALADRPEGRAVVVTDSVFSIDGAVADIGGLYAACRRHRALLVVDEAHAFGVLGDGGRGAVHAAGLAGAPDVVTTVTLSKALGAQGGAVVGARRVVDHLVNAARTFIFDTGLAPASAGAALAALQTLEGRPTLAADCLGRAADIAVRAGVPAAGGPVVSIVLGDPERALRAREVMAQHGVRVGCFRPPSVPEGTSRLRLTARADLTPSDLDRLSQALVAARTAVGAW